MKKLSFKQSVIECTVNNCPQSCVPGYAYIVCKCAQSFIHCCDLLKAPIS